MLAYDGPTSHIRSGDSHYNHISYVIQGLRYGKLLAQKIRYRLNRSLIRVPLSTFPILRVTIFIRPMEPTALGISGHLL